MSKNLVCGCPTSIFRQIPKQSVKYQNTKQSKNTCDKNKSTVSFLSYLNPLQSVQFSRSVMLDSLQPHESQHARPSCPSPTPGVYSNSCPSSWRCHPAISSSSAVPVYSCPQCLPASGSFPMSRLFA